MDPIDWERDGNGSPVSMIMGDPDGSWAGFIGNFVGSVLRTAGDAVKSVANNSLGRAVGQKLKF